MNLINQEMDQNHVFQMDIFVENVREKCVHGILMMRVIVNNVIIIEMSHANVMFVL